MPCFPQAAEPIGRVGRKCSERRCPMATQPEIPPPDRIDPQSPPETPPDSPPSEDPFRQPPDIVPDQPDYDKPARGGTEERRGGKGEVRAGKVRGTPENKTKK